MVHVHAGVYDSNDTRATDVEAGLSVPEANDLRSRLRGVAVGDNSAVIVDGRIVIEAGRDRVDGPLRQRKQLVWLDALDSEKGFKEIPDEAEKIGYQVPQRR